MCVFWDTAENTTDARERWQALASSAVDTNLTLSVNTCNSGCDANTVPQFRLDVRNSGTTVVDYRNLTYIIDGTLHTVTNVTDYDIVSPAAVSGTDLIIPGETMRIEFQNIPVTATYTTSTIPVQVITLDGVIGRR